MASHPTFAAPEKPLEPHRRFFLTLGAMGIIFLAYGFVLTGILVLLVLLLIELALVIGGARFGLAGYFIRRMTSNRYSTHPSLADRLNALPRVPATRPPDPRPGVHLLADPEPLAARLMEEYRRLATHSEQRDDRQLKRSARRFFGGGKLQPLQVLAVAMILFGLMGAFMAAGASKDRSMAVVFLGITFLISGLGVLLYRLGTYRPNFTLPIPEYSHLQAAWSRTPLDSETEKQLEAEVMALAPDSLRKSKRVAILSASSHAAFAQCDFPKAFLTARSCIQLQPKSIPGAVAWLMSCAAIGHFRFIPQALQFLRHQTGLHGGDLTWAVSWTFFQMNDWVRAEMCLVRCLRYYPQNPTLLALLAIAQSSRGKWQSARENAAQAARQRPGDLELTNLLVNACIASGEIRQASELLTSRFDSHSPGPQVLVQWIGIHLLTGDVAQAEQIRSRLEEANPTPQVWMEVGLKFETHRQDHLAEGIFHKALEAGFFPVACLGLARVAARRRDPDKSRTYIRRAMDLERPVGEGSIPATQLIGQSLMQLRALGRAVLGCHVWWVILRTSPHPSLPVGTPFLVAAPSRESALTYLQEMFAAMIPTQPPPLEGAFGWEDAPDNLQPDGPFVPGVLAVAEANG